MNYQQEAVADVLDEIRPLLDMHWREVSHYQDIQLRPDWDFYCTAQGIRLYTARDEGRLIGYCVFFVSHNKHYMDSMQAVQDILFVHPEYRGSRAGYRLIKFCDEQLRQEGCQVVYQHMKAAQSFGPLLEHAGYELVDLIYAKRLDKE
mgnify:CR=1 FL=1